MWIQHPDFLNFVDPTWSADCTGSPQYVLAQNLKSMKQVLNVWNKNVFGEINLKVKEAETLVQTLQEILMQVRQINYTLIS